VLVIRRRAGESLLIGEEVEIEILEVCGTRVKIGIVAPDAILIQRKETQITRDENLTAVRSVQRSTITSLLRRVAVKSLTSSDSLTPDKTLVRNRKNTRTVSVHPDMTQ
jgi:carbon storage regulator